MKRVFFALALLFGFFPTVAQKRDILQVTGNWNEMLYSPHTNTLFKRHADGDIRASRFNIAMATGIISGRFNWNAGLSWVNTTYRFVDQVRSVEYYESQLGGGLSYKHYDYEDPADLASRSNAFGVYNELAYLLKSSGKYTTLVGMANETYLLEWYTSQYESSDNLQVNDGNNIFSPYSPPVEWTETSNHFYVSSSALSAFYRPSLNTAKALRPALQLSLGTNLYSDWSQFRKCAWIGIGLNCEWVRRIAKE